MSDEQPYILRINEVELNRLEFQHHVWKKVSDAFFARIGVKAGWKCLDVGSGPGFVANDLREIVGESGEVTALEPAEYYLEHFEHTSTERGWKNIKFIHGSAETAELPKNYYDLIFIRWVLCFVPDPNVFIQNIVSSLKPGGIIAIQDYLYAGLGLYPSGGAFDHALETVVRHWGLRGGDAHIAARIPKIFRDNGLELIDYSPHVRAEGPESDLFEWADRYFTVHFPIMAEDGATTKELADAMVADWYAHKKNPDTIFCSPILVDMAGKKT